MILIIVYVGFSEKLSSFTTGERQFVGCIFEAVDSELYKMLPCTRYSKSTVEFINIAVVNKTICVFWKHFIQFVSNCFGPDSNCYCRINYLLQI